ncbi:MAG: hypothetical protein ABI249_10065 [Ornithinibacter sp.]
MRLRVIDVRSSTIHHSLLDAPAGLQPLEAPRRRVRREGTTLRGVDGMS